MNHTITCIFIPSPPHPRGYVLAPGATLSVRKTDLNIVILTWILEYGTSHPERT